MGLNKGILKLTLIFMAIAASAWSLPSCKKTVEKQTENYVMGIITDGRWYMYEFTEDSVDITRDFFGFEFQFYDNGKVDCIRSTIIDKGTWTPDITNYTIAANFSTAGYPLNRLNNVWKIVDSYTNAVMAVSTSGTTSYKMTLVKK